MVFIHLLLPPFPGDRNHFYEGVSQAKKLVAEREVVIKVILSCLYIRFYNITSERSDAPSPLERAGERLS